MTKEEILKSTEKLWNERNRLEELEKENKIREEIIIGEQQEINDLKKENEELKKEKIPHLERRIACNRGNVRVLNEKLKCRLEQVERLKSERNQLREEIEKLKKQIEDLQISEYSNLWEQRRTMHRNLIEAFSEQLGILDKEEDELFSLKAIKEVIGNVLELKE